MSDRYGSFRELQAHEQENVDYRIKVRDSKYPVLIMGKRQTAHTLTLKKLRPL